MFWFVLRVVFCLSVLYILDKNQLAKQKNNCTSKRGDKRNLKLHAKTKHDSFSVKAGLPSFGSAAGGNNFFGMRLLTKARFCLSMNH